MKKIKINYLNNEFLLNESVLQNTDFHGNATNPKVVINRVVGATMIKQFVKKHFKGIKVWSTSETFSMGNAIDVNVSNVDGSPIPTENYEKIDSFAQSLRMGRFNGMEDIYEYNRRDKKTDNGIELETWCKYITVNNSPKFGTIEWGLENLRKNENETPEDILYYIDNNKKEKFLEAVKS